jgi:predicted SprT family Zn-dependent metalloprotease
MARKTTFHYSCDACGTDVDRQRDLQRFGIHVVHAGRQQGATMTDLCGDCEARFLASVEAFFEGENLARLHAMSREEE